MDLREPHKLENRIVTGDRNQSSNRPKTDDSPERDEDLAGVEKTHLGKRRRRKATLDTYAGEAAQCDVCIPLLRDERGIDAGYIPAFVSGPCSSRCSAYLRDESVTPRVFFNGYFSSQCTDEKSDKFFMWACSSVRRALGLHPRGGWSKASQVHQNSGEHHDWNGAQAHEARPQPSAGPYVGQGS